MLILKEVLQIFLKMTKDLLILKTNRSKIMGNNEKKIKKILVNLIKLEDELRKKISTNKKIDENEVLLLRITTHKIKNLNKIVSLYKGCKSE